MPLAARLVGGNSHGVGKGDDDDGDGGGAGDGDGGSGSCWPQTGWTGPANHLSSIVSPTASTPWMTIPWIWKIARRKSRQAGG